jgi:hypothetical protein
MITLELSDGSTKKFNLPIEKEQKLFDLWVSHNNKSIKFNLSNEEINIKLSDIYECYIGEKEIPKNKYKDDDTVNYLKSMFGMFNG